MAREYYKVHENLGVKRKLRATFAVVLVTGAGSSFIRKSAIPENLWTHIRRTAQTANIRDANGRRVNIGGIVDLVVEVGMRTEVFQFKVNERLGTDVILGCAFCHTHVEAIRSRQREVELDDRTIIPILKIASARVHQETPSPAAQQYQPSLPHSTDKIKVVTGTELITS